VKLFVTSNSFQTTILAVPNFPSEILNLHDEMSKRGLDAAIILGKS
jgi:hypothetical protein